MLTRFSLRLARHAVGVFALLLLPVGVGCGQAQGTPGAPSLTFAVTILRLPRGMKYFIAGLNARGEICGSYLTPEAVNVTHAFIFREGKLQILSQGNSAAYAINDRGEVVGETNGRAFLYSGGKVRDLGTLGGRGSVAYAISNTGVIVGESRLPEGWLRAFIYSDGAMHELKVGESSSAYAINDRGDVVGTANRQAFLYSGGKVRDLGTLGGDASVAYAINNAGVIVGESSTAHYVELSGDDPLCETHHATLWQQGKIRDLDSQDSLKSAGRQINDAGWILCDSMGLASNEERSLCSLAQDRPIPLSSLRLRGANKVTDALTSVLAINNKGQMVVQAGKGEKQQVLLLSPIAR